MNFAEQLVQVAEKEIEERAKRTANNLISKLREVAEKGLFKLELNLRNTTTEDEGNNKVAISNEFTKMQENELDGVLIYGEFREGRGLFGQTYPTYY